MASSSERPTQKYEADQSVAAATDPGFATTLARGLAILEAFQPGDAGLGNTELAARTGLSRPTAARLSSTLAQLGYLIYDETRAKFRLGKQTLRLSLPVLSDMRVRQLARPLMQELATSVGGTVSLGTLDGLSVIYVESARGGELAPHVPEIGLSLPLLRTAIGRALVTLLSTEERVVLDARFAMETSEMWHDYGANYRNGLLQCAEREFCLSEGDFEPTVHGVAVPLYRAANGGDCFALNCAIAAYRLKPGEMVQVVGPRLRALAASVRALVRG